MKVDSSSLRIGGHASAAADPRTRGLALLAALGALSFPSILPGCKEHSAPQPAQREQVTASQDPSAARAILQQIGRDLREIYKTQNASGPMSVDAAAKIVNQICEQCKSILPHERMGELSPEAQSGDFSRPPARDSLSRALVSSGVLLSVGVKSTDQPEKVYVTAELLLLKPELISFQAPQFSVGSMKLPSVDGVRIRSLKEEILPHYEHSPGNRLTGEAFILPGQYVPAIDTVVLNSAAIRVFAAQTGKTAEQISEMVILNELAHASFERLVAKINAPEQLVIDLSMPGGPSLSVDIHHLSEAFSDYVSLRHGSDVIGLLEERGAVAVADYQLSHFLLKRGLAAVLRVQPELLPVAQVNRETFEASALASAAYLKAHPEKEAAVRVKIADTYEEMLARLIPAILQQP